MEAAFFDLDKTVIAKASMVAFGRPLRRAGMIDRRLLAKAVWSGLVFRYLGADEARLLRFRESALRITKGWDRSLIGALVADTLPDVIEPIIYDEALTLIREHRAAGRRVYLVSASPEEIVEPLGRFLGVDESIASRASVDAQGRYTGEVDFYAYGPFKVDAIEAVAERDGIDLEASYAYSDSATDLPMLGCVGHPVAVNPDRALAREARARGWEVLQFHTIVPLGDRVPMPGPGRVALTAAAVAGGALGATAGWWVLRRRRATGARRPPTRRPAGWVRRPAAS
ncbi:HAD family hydrolase [Rhabdothermincola salaria]|uniref:HAD family hydrolase n=1 Tax=Rhabdothermincola salaria TaxID=2903142 RepID=UPI001E653833|nr:HAD-IB family hydrolase [Rhabdothermincola salaria]